MPGRLGRVAQAFRVHGVQVFADLRVGAQVSGEGERVASALVVDSMFCRVLQVGGDGPQGVAVLAVAEFADVEDRREGPLVDGPRVGGDGLVQHPHGAVAHAVAAPAAGEDRVEQRVALRIGRVPVLGEQGHARLAVVDEHGRDGHLDASALLFRGVGEPWFGDHGRGRVDRIGGALPGSGPSEVRACPFGGRHRFRGRVVEPVPDEPVVDTFPFGSVGQVAQQPVHVVEFAAHVSRQVFRRGQGRVRVRVEDDEVAEPGQGPVVVVGAEQTSDEVEVHGPFAVEADGQRVDRVGQAFGHGWYGADDPFGEHVALGLETLGAGPLQRIEAVQARIGVVRVERAQVLLGVEPSPRSDEPFVCGVERVDGARHRPVVALRIAFEREEPFGLVAQPEHVGQARVAAFFDA